MENGQEVTANSMQFYCNKYCRFNGVCKKNYIPKLMSTIKAIELTHHRKWFPFEYQTFPAKTLELMNLLEKTRAEIQNERSSGKT